MTGKGMLMLIFVKMLLTHGRVDSITTLPPNLNAGLVHQEALQLVSADLTQIKTEIFQMNGELKATMNQVQVVTEENQLLKSKISEMQIALDNSQKNHSVIEARLKSNISELEHRLDGVGSVVFMLQFKDDWVSPITDNAILKYDDVVLNVGGGYDTKTGIFICPTAGLYLISVRCNADWKSTGWSKTQTSVYKNNNFLIQCSAEDDENAQADFVQVSVYLDKGDQLLVKQHYDNANEFAGQTWTFFSGVLLVPKE